MTKLTITPYERRHRSAVLYLLYQGAFDHIHLDWYQPDQWLDLETGYIQVAEDQYGAPNGFVAISDALYQTAWVRLLAIRERRDITNVLRALWDSITPILQQANIQSVNILVINQWIARHLENLGFQYHDQVISLVRQGQLDFQPENSEVTIRTAYIEDLPDVCFVDQHSFQPPWQLAYRELYQAQRQAAVYTVAEQEGKIVAYQLSTLNQDQGHLARLAVLPEVQGHGIGNLLVSDAVQRFQARGIETMTVNTQETNATSQRLYQRLGFIRNGYDLPVWTYSLA